MVLNPFAVPTLGDALRVEAFLRRDWQVGTAVAASIAAGNPAMRFFDRLDNLKRWSHHGETQHHPIPERGIFHQQPAIVRGFS